MLTSIAIILLLGLLVGWIFSKLRLPSLLGMIIVGIILSPYALNLIDGSILMISGDLRQIALVIILTRAGLSLDISDLKKSWQTRSAYVFCTGVCRNLRNYYFSTSFAKNISVGCGYYGECNCGSVSGCSCTKNDSID